MKKLPQNWIEKQISDIANISVGKDVREASFSKVKTDNHNYPVFSNTVDNYGLYGFYDFPEYNSDGLTIVGRGAGLGTAFARKSGFGAIGRLLVLSPKDHEFDSIYLSYFINNRFRLFNESGGIPQLPGVTLGKYKVILPPLPEQRAIADILSTWDTAIEKMEKLIEAKEKRFRGLLYKLIWRDNWDKIKLSDLFGDKVSIEKGKALTKKELQEGMIPVIAGGQTYAYYTQFFTHDRDTITISASGANAGYVWFHDYPIWASDCNVIYVNRGSTKFLYYVLKTLQNKIYLLQSGGAQPHVYSKDLKILDIVFPSEKEQEDAAKILSNYENEIELLRELSDNYKKQKRGLMQKLLTGEWRVGV